MAKRRSAVTRVDLTEIHDSKSFLEAMEDFLKLKGLSPEVLPAEGSFKST